MSTYTHTPSPYARHHVSIYVTFIHKRVCCLSISFVVCAFVFYWAGRVPLSLSISSVALRFALLDNKLRAPQHCERFLAYFPGGLFPVSRWWVALGVSLRAYQLSLCLLSNNVCRFYITDRIYCRLEPTQDRHKKTEEKTFYFTHTNHIWPSPDKTPI